MARRLPPLNALRAFEAAARHLSFTRAAAELHVTQAAISHQVKALEVHLGRPLFRRLNRALLLTEDAQMYGGGLREAFDMIDAATTRLQAGDSRGVLTVSVLPSFAAKWLVPRLGRFRAAHPGIDVRLAPSTELVDFARDDVDIGIRAGAGHYPGLRTVRLLAEDMFPVCAPALIDGEPPLHEPADLRRHTLLHDDGYAAWGLWLRAAGASAVEAEQGPIFLDASMALLAAAAGQGVALARGELAAGDLADGRLVRPFALSLPAEFAYYVVCPEGYAERPKVRAFREWLLAEAGAPTNGE